MLFASRPKLSREDLEEKIDLYISKAATQPIKQRLLNIKNALKATLLRLPLDILEDLINSDDPVVIIDMQRVACTTSFMYKFNSIRILQISENLNSSPVDVIIGVLSHEIAHVYLHGKSVKRVPNAELQADAQAIAWGFKKELSTAKRVLNDEKSPTLSPSL